MRKILLPLLFACFGLPFTASAIYAWQEVGPASASFQGNNGNFAMAVDAAGNVYMSGFFTNSNGNYYVAKWNGTTWAPLGNLDANDRVRCITLDSKGNVYAAGAFKNVAPRNNYFVSKWNGVAWKELRNDTSYLKANSVINTVVTDAAGNVYAAGVFTDGLSVGNGRPYVAKWDGAKWAEVGKIDPSLQDAYAHINALAFDPSGNLYAAGNFKDATGKTLVLKWNGTTWIALPPIASSTPVGYPNGLLAMVADKLGNIYTSGNITNTAGTIYVAKWNGSSWSEVASATSTLGVPGSRVIFSLAVTPTGSDVYAAGYTEKQPPSNLAYVAHWNGTFWSELGAAPYALHVGQPGGVWALGLDGTNNVYATGEFLNPSGRTYVAKYANYPGLSVPAASNSTELRVYPVPNKGRFTVTGTWVKSNTQPVTVQISNAIGQEVYTAVLQPSGSLLSIDVSGTQSIPDGIYQLRILVGGQTYTHTIQISR